jgi:hypothetical protein
MLPNDAAGEEIVMRPDRPLIGAVVTLAAGIATILVYCHGTTAFNVSYPFSGSQLHIDLTTIGPAVLGGIALIAVGILLLAWALLAAIGCQIARLFGRNDEVESIIGRYRAPSFEDDYPSSSSITGRKNES